MVTNSHILVGGNSVVRVNTLEGRTEAIPTDEQSWIRHPDGDDVALLPIFIDRRQYQHIGLDSRILITRQIMDELHIGPGEEAFFVGRFISHEGRQRNQPTVRFGNISMMPSPVRNRETGIDQESFLVEARSLPGYSGSPVFVYIPPLVLRPPDWKTLRAQTHGPFVLGIDWSHIAPPQPVLEKDGKTPVPEGWIVEQNAGMMGVVPAWKIQDLLDLDEVVAKRREVEDRLKRNLEEIQRLQKEMERLQAEKQQ